MIKVQNNTATREPIPAFLQGLSLESLADLSWTDPALGVSDAAWWPVEVVTSPLGQFEVYGAETLTVIPERQVVQSAQQAVPMSQDQINAMTAQRAAEIRQQRNARLAALDWTQGKDLPDSISTPAAATRQALRDITTQAGFPWTIDWPVAP